jgi:hypothetical protein
MEWLIDHDQGLRRYPAASQRRFGYLAVAVVVPVPVPVLQSAAAEFSFYENG